MKLLVEYNQVEIGIKYFANIDLINVCSTLTQEESIDGY